MHLTAVLEVLVLVGSLGYVVALFCACRLSRETGNERYWFFFVVAALGLGIHQWIKIPQYLGIIGPDTAYRAIRELAEIVGALAFAYASYGLCTSMRAIRRKMESP